MVAALALYRAESFIHELTHIKHAAVPGFRLGWNLLVGIPLLTPSFMYEGVHNLHHARTRYGTAEDPEYLPLALMKWWTLPVFILVSALAPVALLVRYAVLTPLSVVDPAAAPRGRRALFGLADQPVVPPPPARGRGARAVASAGGRRERLCDRADRADRDGDHPAQGVPDLPRRHLGPRGDQPGPHARRASVGE